VPLGAHLSGGIDSSAIVALISKEMAKGGEPLRTFSGAFREGNAYDERRYIRPVVERHKTDHHETLPCAHDLPALIDKLIWHMDEPAAGPGILLQWAVCHLSRQLGVTVVNGGQGGDEAWGGYFGYVPAYLRTLLAQARKHPALLAHLASDSLTLLRRRSTRSLLTKAVFTRRRGRLRASSNIGAWAGEGFDAASTSGLAECDEVGVIGGGRVRTPLSAAQYYDLKWYLPALLQVEDRTSMAFSLESRAPLLDYRIIEHAATVPSALRMKGLTTKYILREAVRDLIPPVIYNRTDKMGMPTPIAPWFRGVLDPWIEERLLSEPRSGLTSRRYAEQALKEHRSGQADRSLDLWKILNVETWWRTFIHLP